VVPTSSTALAIIAVLTLMLHIAASDVPAHPLAIATPLALGDDVACPGDAKPTVPSLPFD
jgi:hypothetical protein